MNSSYAAAVKDSSVWIGLLHVRRLPSCNLDWNPEAKGAHVWWTAWASSRQEYETSVAAVTAGYGLFIVEIAHVRATTSESEPDDSLAEIVERTESNENYSIFGTFHNYTSDD